MANVKSVRVTGDLPFDCAEEGGIAHYLATFNGPVCGLRISWSSEPRRMEPNEHGGKTAFYGFVLEGREAVSLRYVMRFTELVEGVGGMVDGVRVVDVENNEVLIYVMGS